MFNKGGSGGILLSVARLLPAS